MEKIGVYMTKLLVQVLLMNPDYLKRFQMKAIACSMTLKYDIRII